MNESSLNWRKSSASGNGGCVEVAIDGTSVFVRDTKDRGSVAALVFSETEWVAFLAGVQSGEFTMESLRNATEKLS